ncbi:MAG: hypothetical protein WAY02_09370, partial [Burkholderiaceae bacterium]
MARGERTFVMKFVGDASAAIAEMSKLGQRFGTIESKLSGTQKVASGIAASGMLQNLGAGFSERLTSSASAAGALEEAMNKSAVVFGEHNAIVAEFAKTSASTFAVAKGDAFSYAGTLGLILQAGGLAQDQSAAMAVDLVKLAADMASFTDIPIADALEKIRAGLVGETEPLRTVGVLLSAAAVDAKAMELGLTDGKRALTEQEKVQSRYAIILEQTAVMQGDIARTADSATNSIRFMEAASKENAAVIGGPVSSVFTALRQLWLGVPPEGQQIVTVLGMVTGGLVLVAAILPSVTAGFGLMAAGVSTAAAAVGAISLAFLGIPLAIAAVIASIVLLWVYWDQLHERARAVRESILSTLGLEGSDAARGGLSAA